MKRLFMYGMSLTMNLVQNYSDDFGNSQRSSLSPTGGVKSTFSTTENGYENCIYSMNNIHMSNEDNKHDTNYINKNDTNTYTRKLLHLRARHVERAVSSSHLDVTCTSVAQVVLESSSHPHAIHERLSLTSPSSLSTSTCLSPSSSTPLS